MIYNDILEEIKGQIVDLKLISQYLSEYFNNNRYNNNTQGLINSFNNRINQLDEGELPDAMKIHSIQNEKNKIMLVLSSYNKNKNNIDSIDNMKAQAEEKYDLSIKGLFIWRFFIKLHRTCIDALKFDNSTLFDICNDKYQTVFNELKLIHNELKREKLEKVKDVISYTNRLLDEKRDFLREDEIEKIITIKTKYERAIELNEQTALLSPEIDSIKLENIKDRTDKLDFSIQIMKKLDQCIPKTHHSRNYIPCNDDKISEWVEQNSVNENFDKIIQSILEPRLFANENTVDPI